MSKIGLHVSSGKYVVPKTPTSDWVYDVSVELDGRLVAVVGFTEKQTNGALFWQLDYEQILDIFKDMGHQVDLEIKNLAKQYFINHT